MSYHGTILLCVWRQVSLLSPKFPGFFSEISRCKVDNSVNTSIIRIRVQATLTTFNSTLFMDDVAYKANITRSRLSIVKLSEGSVIVDMQIGKSPAGSLTEGDATRTANYIASIVQTGSTLGGYSVRNFSDISGDLKIEHDSCQVLSSPVVNPVDSVTVANVQTVERSSIPAGAIIGIVLGVVVIASVIAVAGYFLYRRTIKNQKSIWAKQMDMIDLKSINLGEARTAIVSDTYQNDVREKWHVPDTLQWGERHTTGTDRQWRVRCRI